MLKLCFALFILGIFTFNSNAMVMSFSRLRPSNDEYFDVSNVKVSFKKSLLLNEVISKSFLIVRGHRSRCGSQGGVESKSSSQD